MFASKRGRPRTQGVARYPSGQIKPEAITATAEEARIRQLWGVDVWQEARRNESALREARKKVSNPLLGHALGRLFYSDQIDRKQYDAGTYFGWLWKAHARLTGAPPPNVRAIDYGAVSSGFSVYPEDTDEWVADIKRRWMDAHRFIYEANGDHGRSTGPIMEILKRTLVEDIGPLDKHELGNLRIGLNAINQARGV